VAQDLFSFLKGCNSGDCTLSQFVQALSLMPIANLNVGGEVDMVFSVVFNLTYLSNMNSRIKLSKLPLSRLHFSLRVNNII